MMTNELKDKISKIYELVKRGDQGEQTAAKNALDKILKKHNLSDKVLEDIDIKKYSFKYSNNLEMWLISHLKDYFFETKKIKGYRNTYGVREAVLSLEYIDYILLSTAYEYFRKHMMNQYKKLILPQIKRCRSVKTKNARRLELQNIFYDKYIIASNLYKPKDIIKIDTSQLTQKELNDRIQLQGVQGGEYSTQVTTGLYIETT